VEAKDADEMEKGK